jgi:hypothetical protein
MGRSFIQANLVEQQESLSIEMPVEANYTNFNDIQPLVLDTGTSSHVTGDRNILSDYQPISLATGFSTANGARLSVAGTGTLRVDDNKELTPLLYVPGLTKNLISVGKLCDSGKSVHFNPELCFVLDKRTPCKVFLFGIRDPCSHLYHINTSKQMLEAHLQKLAVSTISSKLPVKPPYPPDFAGATEHAPMEPPYSSNVTDLWHKRLGHLNHQTAFHMSSKKFFIGLPPLQVGKDRKCEACVLGKQSQAKMGKRASHKASRPLQVVHSDLCGPFKEEIMSTYSRSLMSIQGIHGFVFLRLKVRHLTTSKSLLL